MQIHICKYVSEGSTDLCIKDIPDGKIIISSYIHMSEETIVLQPQMNNTDALKLQSQSLKERQCLGSTQPQISNSYKQQPKPT